MFNFTIDYQYFDFSYDEIELFIYESILYLIYTFIIYVLFIQYQKNKELEINNINNEKKINILVNHLNKLSDFIENNNNIYDTKLNNILIEKNNQTNNLKKILLVYENKIAQSFNDIYSNLQKNMMNFDINIETRINNHLQFTNLELIKFKNYFDEKESTILLGWNNVDSKLNYLLFHYNIDNMLNKISITNDSLKEHNYIIISKFRYFPKLRKNLSLQSIWYNGIIYVLNDELINYCQINMNPYYINNNEQFKSLNYIKIENKNEINKINILQKYCLRLGIILINDLE